MPADGKIVGMKSKVHPKYKTRYKVANWPAYDRALIRRGDVTLCLAPDAIAGWEPRRGGTRGGQRRYSDVAIETALTLRLFFHLPLRQAEGFLVSVFAITGLALSTPDHTTLSRRGQSLDLALRRVRMDEPLHLFIDSTGLTVMGQGEWAAAKHGTHGKRRWSKLHVGVDQRGVIVAQVVSEDSVRDAAAGVDLIHAVDDEIASVTADAAYDTLEFYETAGAGGATVVVPPKETASVTGRGPRSPARDRTIESVQSVGRRQWKKDAVGTIGRRGRRTRSSGTNRSSAGRFGLAVHGVRRSRGSSRATS